MYIFEHLFIIPIIHTYYIQDYHIKLVEYILTSNSGDPESQGSIWEWVISIHVFYINEYN